MKRALAFINEQLQGASADLQALEKSFAQSERERWLYSRSLDRIPELVADGEMLAAKYKMDYAVVRNLDGAFALCAADTENQMGFIRRINWRAK